MKTILTLRLPEDQSFLPTVRRMAKPILDSCHVASEDIGVIEFILVELGPNAVRHAHSAADYFKVCLEVHHDQVTVTVKDYGQGFDRSAVPPLGALRKDIDGQNRYSGFGLHLVGMLADIIEFHQMYPTGTTVVVEKRLQGTG